MTLRPCPFCGTDSAENINGLIQCRKCAAVGPFTKSELRGGPSASIDAWNNRPQTSMDELVDAVNRCNANVNTLADHVVRLGTAFAEYIQKTTEAIETMKGLYR